MPSLLRGFREQHRSAVMEISIKFFHQCRQRKLQINFEVVKKIHIRSQASTHLFSETLLTQEMQLYIDRYPMYSCARPFVLSFVS